VTHPIWHCVYREDVEIYLAVHVAYLRRFVHNAFVRYLKMSIEIPSWFDSLITCGAQEAKKNKITLCRLFYNEDWMLHRIPLSTPPTRTVYVQVETPCNDNPRTTKRYKRKIPAIINFNATGVYRHNLTYWLRDAPTV